MKVSVKKQQSTMIIAIITFVAAIIVPVVQTNLTTFQPETQLYDSRVCAFYYLWYGNTTHYNGEHPDTASVLMHWNDSYSYVQPPIIHHPEINRYDITATDHPTLGTNDQVLYDSTNPITMRYHMGIAEGAGIDSFICSWWGRILTRIARSASS